MKQNKTTSVCLHYNYQPLYEYPVSSSIFQTQPKRNGKKIPLLKHSDIVKLNDNSLYMTLSAIHTEKRQQAEKFHSWPVSKWWNSGQFWLV